MQYEIYWLIRPTLHSKVVWQHSNIEILEKKMKILVALYMWVMKYTMLIWIQYWSQNAVKSKNCCSFLGDCVN